MVCCRVLEKIPGMQVCEACSSVRNASNNDCTRHNSFQRAAMEFYKTQTFSLAAMWNYEQKTFKTEHPSDKSEVNLFVTSYKTKVFSKTAR